MLTPQAHTFLASGNVSLPSTPSFPIPLDYINFNYTYDFITDQLWRLSWILGPGFSRGPDKSAKVSCNWDSIGA